MKLALIALLGAFTFANAAHAETRLTCQAANAQYVVTFVSSNHQALLYRKQLYHSELVSIMECGPVNGPSTPGAADVPSTQSCASTPNLNDVGHAAVFTSGGLAGLTTVRVYETGRLIADLECSFSQI